MDEMDVSLGVGTRVVVQPLSSVRGAGAGRGLPPPCRCSQEGQRPHYAPYHGSLSGALYSRYA
jgi:hypothetical protein